MVTINDKLSLIIDVDQLLDLQDGDVYDVIEGDTYKIDATYKRILEIFRENVNREYVHMISGEVMSLSEWADWYGCDINDAKSITTFLRYGVYAFRYNF